jgi:hypothetical protein
MVDLSGGEDRHFAVTYRLTRNDVAAYEDLPGTFSARAKLALFLPLFVIGAVGEWLLSAFGVDTASWSTLQRYAVIGAAIAVWFALATLGLSLGRRRRIRRFPLPPDEVRLTVGRDGVAYDEGSGMERYEWQAISWVRQGRTHVFMRTARQRVIIVPLRAFTDAEALGHFAKFVGASSRAVAP